MKKIFWLAGENSGDLHAAEVLTELNRRKKDYLHFGIGGEKMENQGFHSLFPFEKFSVMGFAEVIKHLPFFLKVEKKIREIFFEKKPDLVILVDYPGLNLRIAAMASKHGIPVLYFISPQFWAWKRKRVFALKKFTKQVAYIFPFEGEYLEKAGVKSTFVGHPIAEEIEIKISKKQFAEKFHLDLQKRRLGFFPGSRNTEIRKILPVFIETIEKFDANEFEFLISKATTVNDDLFGKLTKSQIGKVKIITRNRYEMMKYCDFSVVTSGTATLENAFLGTPFLIVYKTGKISYEIGKRIIKIGRIGLPNIILNENVIPELIQNEVNAERIFAETMSVLNSPEKYEEIEKKLMKIQQILGSKSVSAEMVNIIEKMLNE